MRLGSRHIVDKGMSRLTHVRITAVTSATSWEGVVAAISYLNRTAWFRKCGLTFLFSEGVLEEGCESFHVGLAFLHLGHWLFWVFLLQETTQTSTPPGSMPLMLASCSGARRMR